MAEFLEAYNVVQANEGGYVNDPTDRGQETYCGISRKNWPKWQGWDTIDRRKPEHGEVLKDLVLAGLVKNFYKTNFWDKIQADFITDQHVATFIYDWYVNSGGSCIEPIQRSSGAVIDGRIGNNTLTAINAHEPYPFLQKLKAARIAFVNNIVRVHPEQIKYLKGWVNRINSF